MSINLSFYLRMTNTRHTQRIIEKALFNIKSIITWSFLCAISVHLTKCWMICAYSIDARITPLSVTPLTNFPFLRYAAQKLGEKQLARKTNTELLQHSAPNAVVVCLHVLSGAPRCACLSWNSNSSLNFQPASTHWVGFFFC